MTGIELTVTGAFAKAKVTGKITAGMVGCKVCVKLDTAWDGLTPTLVAKSGGEATAMVIGADGWSEVPHERCIGSARLLLGIDGKSADGKKRIPTVWADCGIVAASPADEELTQSVEPTPELVDQIAAQAHQAALDAAIAQEVARQAEAGEFDGFSPTAKVEDGDDVVTVTITDKDGAHSFTVPKDASPELVAQTVAAYFAEHPIAFPVQSVNGKTGAVKLTAEDVGALPDSTVIPPDLTQEVAEAVRKAEEAEAIAKGRATGYVFDTYRDMLDWVAAHRAVLVIGDNLYIRAQSTPDYWWDGIQPQVLETEKVDLSGYARTEDLASRANVSLSNLDALGLEKFKAENLPYGDGNVAAALASIPTKLSQLDGDSQHRVVTDGEKQMWNGKQNALTFDATPTAGSTNPVTSGGVAAAIFGAMEASY